MGKNKNAYLVLQLDQRAKVDRTAGLGVIKPVACDGYWMDLDRALDIAAWFEEQRPHLETVVVSVVKRKPGR